MTTPLSEQEGLSAEQLASPPPSPGPNDGRPTSGLPESGSSSSSTAASTSTTYTITTITTANTTKKPGILSKYTFKQQCGLLAAWFWIEDPDLSDLFSKLAQSHCQAFGPCGHSECVFIDGKWMDWEPSRGWDAWIAPILRHCTYISMKGVLFCSVDEWEKSGEGVESEKSGGGVKSQFNLNQ